MKKKKKKKKAFDPDLGLGGEEPAPEKEEKVEEEKVKDTQQNDVPDISEGLLVAACYKYPIYLSYELKFNIVHVLDILFNIFIIHNFVMYRTRIYF